VSTQCRNVDPQARRGAIALMAMIALIGLGACSKQDAPAPVATLAGFPSPVRDPSDGCADVAGDLRVCWGAPNGPGCSNGTCVSAQTKPKVAISPLGFRCPGSGEKRLCRDRELDAPRFHCDGTRCTQRHPRMPDDGEWECASVAGAVVCRGGQPPAGIPKGSSDSGYVCGARRTRTGALDERICVDFSPDFPDGNGEKTRCSFESEGGVAKVCERDPNAHVLGDSCDRTHPCIDGARCVASRCVPVRPEPSCFIPADCDHGTCRFGTCTEDPT
jgi:hypothetical protein